jgi:hypothetical protein
MIAEPSSQPALALKTPWDCCDHGPINYISHRPGLRDVRDSQLCAHELLSVCSSYDKEAKEGHFTLRPKVERSSISTNQIARNQEFGLLSFTREAKIQRASQFKMLTFDKGDGLLKEV